jgi:hypothetical protein
LGNGIGEFLGNGIDEHGFELHAEIRAAVYYVMWIDINNMSRPIHIYILPRLNAADVITIFLFFNTLYLYLMLPY